LRALAENHIPEHALAEHLYELKIGELDIVVLKLDSVEK
jgi:hypothetical protein